MTEPTTPAGPTVKKANGGAAPKPPVKKSRSGYTKLKQEQQIALVRILDRFGVQRGGAYHYMKGWDDKRVSAKIGKRTPSHLITKFRRAHYGKIESEGRKDATAFNSDLERRVSVLEAKLARMTH